jgi:superfamily II RNA helicase
MPDFSRKHHRRRSHSRKPPPGANLTPGADSKLKRIFASIGTPEKKQFTPDPFQLDALKVIPKADCLVTAPTGSGKTWIAEQAIQKILDNRGKAWYASPLKALSNAKYGDFSKLFGPENLGILTGDRKENTDAPIIVGTTEILRNQLYDAMHRGEDLSADFVILDEAHFLGDEDRGVVWEETMIYLPSRIPLLMLSATIGNARQIADWLESVRGRKCMVIEESVRPVPLFPVFLHPSGTLFPLLEGIPAEKSKPRLHAKVYKTIHSRQSPRLSYAYQLPPMGAILEILRKYRLLPAIFFLKSRADCDGALAMCASHSREEDLDRQDMRLSRINDLIDLSPHIADHKQMKCLKKFAVAAHHSGQLPAWKLIIETLMTEGLLDAVFATSTVAAGVNFPARTIVILNSDRFNGRDFLPLTPTEFHQMTGRAGRRGMDNIGFALIVPGKFMDTHLIAKLFSAASSDVASQIRINFSMTLNLLLSHAPDQIKELLEKSFAAFMMKTPAPRLYEGDPAAADARLLWGDFLRHLDFLKEKEYVTEDHKLTEDGQWASQLRIDHPLMVAEGFRSQLFPKSDPAILAGIMASFVNERETDDDAIDASKIPKTLLKNFKKIDRGLKPFAAEMRACGFASPTLYFLPCLTIYLWARGVPWEKALEVSKMAEGDLAMLILRTADNLRHIGNLREVFPDAARTAMEAVDLILRDPVVATYGE